MKHPQGTLCSLDRVEVFACRSNLTLSCTTSVWCISLLVGFSEFRANYVIRKAPAKSEFLVRKSEEPHFCLLWFESVDALMVRLV